MRSFILASILLIILLLLISGCHKLDIGKTTTIVKRDTVYIDTNKVVTIIDTFTNTLWDTILKDSPCINNKLNPKIKVLIDNELKDNLAYKLIEVPFKDTLEFKDNFGVTKLWFDEKTKLINKNTQYNIKDIEDYLQKNYKNHESNNPNKWGTLRKAWFSFKNFWWILIIVFILGRFSKLIDKLL